MTKINLSQPPALDHIFTLTTQKGLYQHCRFNEPDKKFGYSIDDNARAILVAYQYYELWGNKRILDLASIYFKYIFRAQMPTGAFHNFASSAGNFIDVCGSQDSQGRTIWALGYMVGKSNIAPEMAKKAKIVLDNFKFDMRSIRYERAKAFSLLGFYYAGDKVKVKKIADRLVQKFEKNDTDSWHWFENQLTYSNAILPYALLQAYDLVGDMKYKKVGLKSLKFLHQRCLVDGVPAPIGQNGWYRKGKKKALYDQQVVDVCDMVLAHVKAYELTQKKDYLKAAELWWSWFFGNNTNHMSMINPKTKGVYDGLTHNGINLNQGAESTVCYLLSYLAMARIKSKIQNPNLKIKNQNFEVSVGK